MIRIICEHEVKIGDTSYLHYFRNIRNIRVRAFFASPVNDKHLT